MVSTVSVKSVAIVGAGIAGASCARLLQDRGINCVVFEASKVPGGLVKCTRTDGNLFHRTGGHVFNTKDPKVANWFWLLFDQTVEFCRHDRRAIIWLEDRFINYPIENHIQELQPDTAAAAVSDLLTIHAQRRDSALRTTGLNFEDFLLATFGRTLCDAYFLPYNKKIWGDDLSQISIEWLHGKLPMPTARDILTANILRREEQEMVHSSFYYPKESGSQHIVDRLLRGCELRLSSSVTSMEAGKKIRIGQEVFDAAIYTGDVRCLSDILETQVPELLALMGLKSNGTTTVLCSCDANPYSWVYVPNPKLASHRIIMTGNFSAANNASVLRPNRISCTLEFSGVATDEQICSAIKILPFNLREIDRNYETNSYILQDEATRTLIANARGYLQAHNVWLCGRFAEWEYFNMDAVMASAMKVVDELCARWRAAE